ncbi:MAG: hypothetical protein RLZZ72_131 [Actinomycetota bacterium]|jgi:hypothetical protein
MGQIKTIMAEFGVSASFTGQPLEVNTVQSRNSLDLDLASVPELVVRLSRLKATFELNTFGEYPERYLHHPSLGICRNVFDEAGEVVLRAGQLEQLLLETRGNLSDFSRGFRRLTAVPWLDLVEPYRKVADYAVALPRAV